MGRSTTEAELLGLLGKYGSYSFFKSIKICGKTYTISSHFPVRIWPDSTILNIAELQLLWTDRHESLCSLKLYFLPENTPEGRSQRHGEDEVIALQDKVIIRISDLMSWLVDESDWDWGYMTPPSVSAKTPSTALSKAFLSEKFLKNDKDTTDFSDYGSSKIVVLNYERYIRLRTVFKRLEGSPELSNWLSHPLVLALGGLNVGPNCRLLFAKEVFDYPELEDHELLCNHLAPKLKGKGKKRSRRRNPSLGSESNESETSSVGSCGSEKGKKFLNGHSSSVKTERNDDLVGVKGLVEGFYMGSRPSRDTKEDHVKAEHSTIQTIANKLISDAGYSITNGRVRNQNDATRGGHEHFKGHKEPTISAGGDESPVHAELFGAGLSELAHKLEKSNSLQILPVRPSVIQKSESLTDEDSIYSHKKKMKAESLLNIDAGTPNFRLPQSEMEMIARSWNGLASRALQSIYGPPSLRSPFSAKGSKSAGIKSEQSLSVPSTIKASNSLPKTERPVLSITAVDIDGKKSSSMFPIRLTSPSPYVPTAKIYGDPLLVRNQRSCRSYIESGVTEDSGDILDLSSNVKRRRVITETPQTAKHTSTTEADLLDLSTKPSSSSQQNKNIFHSLADLPPPNAMNHLGLRLTSEVTLFPSTPSSGSIPGNKLSSKDGNASSKAHQNHGNHHSNSSSSAASGSSKSPSPGWMGKQPSVISQGGNVFRSSGGSSASSSHTSGKSHGSSDLKNHLGLDNSNPLSAFSMLKNHLPGMPLPSPQKSPKVHKSELPFSTSSSTKDRHHQSHSSHVQGTSSKPGSTSSSDRDKDHRRDSRVDKNRDCSPQQSRNNHLSHREMPTSFFPKIDPAYLSLLAPPMFMHPMGMPIPGMIGMPPATMEQIQLYKELLQQGLPPQFPSWPLETMKGRGPK